MQHVERMEAQEAGALASRPKAFRQFIAQDGQRQATLKLCQAADAAEVAGDQPEAELRAAAGVAKYAALTAWKKKYPKGGGRRTLTDAEVA
ncbi:hypothetical protein LCGC14_1745560, partial [marine sediment metagenome]